MSTVRVALSAGALLPLRLAHGDRLQLTHALCAWRKFPSALAANADSPLMFGTALILMLASMNNPVSMHTNVNWSPGLMLLLLPLLYSCTISCALLACIN